MQENKPNALLPAGANLSVEQEQAIDSAIAGKNLVILGKAGVGKSTTIYSILEALENEGKKYVVCAPTGVAAINVGGITVHRFISILRKRDMKQINNGEGFDTVVVDEASMLRADLFDELNLALTAYSYDTAATFGGYQVILVGDPGQLPPVINKRENPEEAEFLESEYFSEFFFSAACYARASWKVIELTKIFRQEGDKYPKLLNLIRAGEKVKTLKYLNAKHRATAPVGVVLTARNADASEINRRELTKIPGQKITLQAEMSSTDSDHQWKKNEYPADEFLELKLGAKVMLIKNIYRAVGDRWEMVLTNGDIGTVEYLDGNVLGFYSNRLNQVIDIHKDEDGVWTKEKVTGYQEHTARSGKKVKGRPIKEPVAVFIQMPVRLAYAMTIHKSQGATISEPFTVDLRKPMFAAGQLYVALSRGVNLSDLHILGKVRPRDIIASKPVNDYLEDYKKGVGIKPGSTYNQLEQEELEESETEELDEIDKMLLEEQQQQGE